MSYDYWHMKLHGTYVHHEGAYKRIESIHLDEGGWEEASIPSAYPEDMLPYLTFDLCDQKRGAKGVKYKDFEIRFPDDQWYKTKSSKASLLSRSMNRQYKIAPTQELFSMTVQEPLNDALDACEKQVYDSTDSMFEWALEDKVFSKKLCLRRTGRKTRTLMYYETPVALMTRGEKWIKLEQNVSFLPGVVTNTWGEQLGKQIAAPEDTTVPEGVDYGALNYNWLRQAPAPGRWAGRQFETMRDSVRFSISEYADGTLAATSKTSIDMFFLEGKCTRRERYDMVRIFNDEIGENV